MAKIGNRVKETSATLGTGTLDLAGAPTGFRAFADEFTSGDEVYYLCVDDVDNPTQYEYGIGTFTNASPDTLARNTVEGSSNGGSKVSWLAGCTVISTPTAAALALLTAVNRFTKIQKWAKGADVASAGALTLGDDGNYFDITGTTSITSIGTKGAGTVVKLHFDAALTLTHHATDLILPGGANITTAAGDEAEFIEYATGDWRCTSYTKANGTAVAGGSAASDTAAGVIEIAVQSELEAASDTARAVPPGRMRFHPGVAKAWVYITTSGGTVTVAASHNVSSVTDNAAGDYTTNFTTAFSSAAYAWVGMAQRDAGQTNHHIINTKGDTAPTASAHRWQTTINSISLNDPPGASVAYFGDQA